MARFARFLPILDWGSRYNRATLTNDLVAAIIVTIMLIPQSLAYALLAGLPPVVGLYASILPLVAYAIFGTSRALAVGPVAVVSLLTAATVSTLAVQGTPEYYAAAIALALLSGLMLTAMGLLRLGFLANLLSHPVISGFITASGIIIAASQLKHILGVSAGGHNLLEVVQQLLAHLGEINLPTLVIGVAATGFLFWVRKGFKPLLMRFGLSDYVAGLVSKAGPVIAVLLTTLVVYLFGLDRFGVRTVGEVPQGLPPFAIPVFDANLWLSLAGPAFLISIIGFVESVSVAQTLAAKRRQSIDSDQELIGLGTSNIASAFSGGYPVTGGFARSVVNFDAGAETPAAGAYTAVGIALASLFLTSLIYFLPVATLAATIIVAVLSLVDFEAIKRTYAYSKHDFAAMIATILITLAMGVEIGVVTGVALSVLLFLWRTSRPHIAVVGQVAGTEHFRNIKRHDVHTSPQVLVLRVDESIYFANARAIEEFILTEVSKRPDLSHVVLQCTAVNLIDASGLESLELTAHRLDASGIKLHLSEVKGPVMDRLTKSDFFSHLTGKAFLTQHQAMRALAPELTAEVDDMARAGIASEAVICLAARLGG
jgi:SulP family sulfate permease